MFAGDYESILQSQRFRYLPGTPVPAVVRTGLFRFTGLSFVLGLGYYREKNTFIDQDNP